MGGLSVDSRSLSLISWAIAKLDVSDPPLMTALAAASLRLVSDAQPQGLANTAWALATSVVRHKPLLDAIAAASLRMMTQFGQQELGNTSWAFAELRVHR